MATPTAPPAPERRTKLGLVAGDISREKVEIPRLGAAWIVLAGHADVQRIESETMTEMRRLGIDLNALTALTYEAERAVRTLAVAVRDPDDATVAFGTLTEWQALDIDIINAAWQVYGDVRERLNPLEIPLTEAERAMMAAAIAKKNSMLLRNFGIAKLALYLATTAAPLES